MSEQSTHAPGAEREVHPEVDPDGDPGLLNPRDLRGVPTGDGAAVGDADPDPDGDPAALNPRDER